jgi:hypothetical protein
MPEQNKDVNPQLFNLVMLFAQTGWYQLGKLPSPVSGKIERDLKAAQWTIDSLIMLKEKTKGNLTAQEEKLIAQTLSSLQLNYADEVKNAQAEPLNTEKAAETPIAENTTSATETPSAQNTTTTTTPPAAEATEKND